jgi:selenide, water dikinase
MQALPLKDLVLVGGGHSHGIALRQFGIRPLPGVRLTLITDVTHAPYSGMLPGYVAGLYGFEDCHIDLRLLCQFAGARMIVDRAVGIDLENYQVRLSVHPPIAFDRLSLDIGSTPAATAVMGAAEFAIPVKPISQFLAYWDQVVAGVSQAPDQRVRLAIVGGGAGGVELAFSVQSRLREILTAAENLELHLVHRGDRLLPERHPNFSQQVQRRLTQRGVHLHLQQTVTEVMEQGILCESGLAIECDRVLWVTQAAAADWLTTSGLATDEQGFVQVNEYLQASHPQVFAAGDVATMVNHPRPKAGVFAVRQGLPLAENLRRSLFDLPLKSFVPQKEFLGLLGTGDRRAFASRGAFGSGAYGWIWNWKDAVDRRFMDQFQNLTDKYTNSSPV